MVTLGKYWLEIVRHDDSQQSSPLPTGQIIVRLHVPVAVAKAIFGENNAHFFDYEEGPDLAWARGWSATSRHVQTESGVICGGFFEDAIGVCYDVAADTGYLDMLINLENPADGGMPADGTAPPPNELPLQDRLDVAANFRYMLGIYA